MAARSFGAFDALRLLSSHSSRELRRSNRFAAAGLINEPGFAEATGPGEHGLRLDARGPAAPPEPFDPAVYGRASGVVGLRLFPDPAFDRAARERWDPERYFTDPAYYREPGPRPPLPRGPVLRPLPREPEPDSPAGRLGEPGVGRPRDPHRRPVPALRPGVRQPTL